MIGLAMVRDRKAHDEPNAIAMVRHGTCHGSSWQAPWFVMALATYLLAGPHPGSATEIS
jgi:hypothetical protein